LVGIIGFGDTFFTILEANIDSCPENFFNRVENNTVANYENEIDNPFCSENHFLSYLSIYRIMLGDLQFELFEDSIITIILFILLTFFGIVIFINMLITLVDESYEKATLHIDRLFGRSRVLMASTIISLEELLQPFPFDKKPCSFSSGTLLRFIMRLLCIALMSVSGFVIIRFWRELEDVNHPTSKVGSSLSLAFLVVPGFLTLGVFFTYFVTGWANARPSNSVLSLIQRNIVTDWLIFAPILFVSRRVLGTSEPSSSSSEQWGGRLSHIDRSIKKAVARSTKELNKSISDISKRLAQLEQNTRTKMNIPESSRNIDVSSQDGSLDRSVEYSMIESTLKELDSKRQEEMEELEKKLIGAISNLLGEGQRSVAYTATDSGGNTKDYSSDDSSGIELL
jgi:negative regulator of replication initiation